MRTVRRARAPHPLPTLASVAAALVTAGAAHAGETDAAVDAAASVPLIRLQCAVAESDLGKLMTDGRLLEAQKIARACADRCSVTVARACAARLEMLEEKIPTVAFVCPELPCTAVEVKIDGVLVEHAFDGLSVALDPGEHTIEFGGGVDSKEQIILRPGEKDRIVRPRVAVRPVPIPGGVPPPYEHEHTSGCCGGTGAASRSMADLRALGAGAMLGAVLLARRRRRQ